LRFLHNGGCGHRGTIDGGKAGGFASQGLGFTEDGRVPASLQPLGLWRRVEVPGYARPNTRGEKTSRGYGERMRASIHVIKLGGCKGRTSSMARNS
jgi:hypothetical protein